MKRVVDVPERDFGIYCRMVDDGMANEAVHRIVKGQPLSEILDKISAEIKERIADCEHGEEIVGDDFGIFAISIQTYTNVLKIIEKYKGVSE